MLLDMSSPPPDKKRGGETHEGWRLQRLFCHMLSHTAANARSLCPCLKTPHLVVTWTHSLPQHFFSTCASVCSDSSVAGFLTDSEWHRLHLPASCQPPEMQQAFCSPICPSASSPPRVAVLGGETTSVALLNPTSLHWAPPCCSPRILVLFFIAVAKCLRVFVVYSVRVQSFMAARHETASQEAERVDDAQLAYFHSLQDPNP